MEDRKKREKAAPKRRCDDPRKTLVAIAAQANIKSGGQNKNSVQRRKEKDEAKECSRP